MRNEEGFVRFVIEAEPRLLRRALLLVGDRQRAEDLVQAALAKAYPRWSRIEEPDAYLRTVMVRTAIGWRARRWHGEVPTEHLPETGDEPADDAALAATVRAALAALPTTQRAVVVLRYFDDLPEAEIAAALGCSPGTVKSRCARALAALRDSGLLTEEVDPA